MINPRVTFGYKKEKADMRIDADVKVGVRLAHAKKYLWFDQLKFEAVFDTKIHNEVLFMDFKRLDLTVPKKRKLPLKNDIKMKEFEYR